MVGPVPGGVEGGPQRKVSVARGLDEVCHDATAVAVHDAARPLAPAAMMVRMYAALEGSSWDGVIPVVPLSDSIKRISSGDRRVLATLKRSDLGAAQTPQVFGAGVLRRAHAAHQADGLAGPAPDDAALVERIGGKVVTVAGDRLAMKITYAEDLLLAETLLRNRSTLEHPHDR